MEIHNHIVEGEFEAAEYLIKHGYLHPIPPRHATLKRFSQKHKEWLTVDGNPKIRRNELTFAGNWGQTATVNVTVDIEANYAVKVAEEVSTGWLKTVSAFLIHLPMRSNGTDDETLPRWTPHLEIFSELPNAEQIEEYLDGLKKYSFIGRNHTRVFIKEVGINPQTKKILWVFDHDTGELMESTTVQMRKSYRLAYGEAPFFLAKKVPSFLPSPFNPHQLVENAKAAAEAKQAERKARLNAKREDYENMNNK